MESPSDDPTQTSSGYGRLGLDIGVVGRWTRFIYGLLVLVPLAVDLADDFNFSAPSLAFFGRVLLYFLLIVALYSAVYWFLGERLLRWVNPWISTLIFVGPALLVSWWNILVMPVTNLHLPTSFIVAMALYIGISLLIQWRIKYGGCEVVSLPIIFFRRRYPSYCVPLVVVDAVEKVVVDRRAPPG